jgi:hypothetical protein
MTVLNLLVQQLRPGIAIVYRFISPITLWLGKRPPELGVSAIFMRRVEGPRRATGCENQVVRAAPPFYSPVATAKLIFSPMRCLTSLSHARGFVP